MSEPNPPSSKPKPGCWKIGCYGVGIIVALFIGSAVVAGIYDAVTGQAQSPGPAVAQAPSDNGAATAAPEPTTPPTASPADLKREFLAQVDESISGYRIAGNPYKYVGRKVDLHGTVDSVIGDSTFNMATGDIYGGTYAIIVIQTDSGRAAQLDKGQDIRVLGTVVEPQQGTNAMGGSMNFPTVQASFIE